MVVAGLSAKFVVKQSMVVKLESLRKRLIMSIVSDVPLVTKKWVLTKLSYLKVNCMIEDATKEMVLHKSRKKWYGPNQQIPQLLQVVLGARSLAVVVSNAKYAAKQFIQLIEQLFKQFIQLKKLFLRKNFTIIAASSAASVTKKITTSDCMSDEGKLFCRKCAKANGITAKQLQSTKTWKSTGGGGSSKFGGGGTKCALCGKTVYMGEQVVYEKKVYHPKCLKCSTCGKILQPAQTDSYEGKNYCHKCFATGGFANKQSKVKWKKGQNAGGGSGKYGGGGVKCYNCGKTVYAGEKVTFEKHTYHVKCFKCDICGNKMTTSTANHFSLETDEHAKNLESNMKKKNGLYREMSPSVGNALVKRM